MADPTDYEIRIIGAPRTPLRDFYHALMRLSWTATLTLIAGGYLAANALFACGYLVTGGIAQANPISFSRAFFFSVQTMGTIGYGAMYPETDAANVLMVVESMVGLLITALATGLIFAKFSRPTARVEFARNASIHPMDGVATLAFRFGNQRGNRIVDAKIRVALVRTEKTREGHTFYRTLDLVLTRDRAPSLSRSWSVLHTVDSSSPLHGETPQSLADKEVEILVSVSGLDDTWMQAVHASHRYLHNEIVFGARPVDILADVPGALILDLSRFHDLEPTEPTDTFPYPTGD